MKPTASTHIAKRVICWILLLQMIHVSMDNISPSGFSERGFFYQTTPSNHPTDTFFKWLAMTIFNTSHYPDAPPSDPSEEHSLLEEFSVCLIWPPLDLEFIHTIDAELFADNFGNYLDNFVPHYSEPNSPPPNQA